MPLPASSAARARPRQPQSQPAFVRLLSRPAERQPVSVEDLAAPAAATRFRTAARRASRITATRRARRALRSAIAAHLAATRGVVVDPGCIVIVNGIQEAINIAARLFLGPGATGAGRDALLSGRGLRLRGFGRATRRRRRSTRTACASTSSPTRPAGLLYLTPSHQYPTGYVLSLEPARATRRLGARATAATSSKTITTATFATRARRCRRSPRSRPIARSISARSPSRSARACGSATSPRRREIAEAVRTAEGAAQQRQCLARSGGARRDDARRRLSRPSHAPAQPLRARAATA